MMAKKPTKKAGKKQAGRKPQPEAKTSRQVKVGATRVAASGRPDAKRPAKPAAPVVKAKAIANDLRGPASANLLALRTRLQADAGKRGKSESSALDAALEKLEADYRELLQG